MGVAGIKDKEVVIPNTFTPALPWARGEPYPDGHVTLHHFKAKHNQDLKDNRFPNNSNHNLMNGNIVPSRLLNNRMNELIAGREDVLDQLTGLNDRLFEKRGGGEKPIPSGRFLQPQDIMP